MILFIYVCIHAFCRVMESGMMQEYNGVVHGEVHYVVDGYLMSLPHLDAYLVVDPKTGQLILCYSSRAFCG